MSSVKGTFLEELCRQHREGAKNPFPDREYQNIIGKIISVGRQSTTKSCQQYCLFSMYLREKRDSAAVSQSRPTDQETITANGEFRTKTSQMDEEFILESHPSLQEHFRHDNRLRWTVDVHDHDQKRQVCKKRVSSLPKSPKQRWWLLVFKKTNQNTRV